MVLAWDSWFFTRWVPGLTITICNKITEYNTGCPHNLFVYLRFTVCFICSGISLNMCMDQCYINVVLRNFSELSSFTCLVPRPHYYERPMRFRSPAWSEKVFRPFISDTSPKSIDREGLKRCHTGTRQVLYIRSCILSNSEGFTMSLNWRTFLMTLIRT